jgi:hypothetical protein
MGTTCIQRPPFLSSIFNSNSIKLPLNNAHKFRVPMVVVVHKYYRLQNVKNMKRISYSCIQKPSTICAFTPKSVFFLRSIPSGSLQEDLSKNFSWICNTRPSTLNPIICLVWTWPNRLELKLRKVRACCPTEV